MKEYVHAGWVGHSATFRLCVFRPECSRFATIKGAGDAAARKEYWRAVPDRGDFKVHRLRASCANGCLVSFSASTFSGQAMPTPRQSVERFHGRSNSFPSRRR